jgi:hypothetical protein
MMSRKISFIFLLCLLLLENVTYSFQLKSAVALRRSLNVYRSPVKLSKFKIGTSISRLSSASVSVSDEKRNQFGKLVFRISWISWWFQIILTVISSVILTFANTVRQTSSSQTLWASGFAFSSIGIIISLFNSFLTWNNSRLGIRRENSVSYEQLRKCFKLSIIVSLVGTFITLLGAEQIVGTLASKVLSLQGFQPSLGTIFSYFTSYII